MARRADDLPDDPVLVVIDEELPSVTFNEWLALAAEDGITDVDADASDILRDIREHGES